MKTKFEEYISNQIQNLEDQLQINDWGELKQRYAKHKRTKTLRILVPAVISASLAIFIMVNNGAKDNLSGNSEEELCIANNNAQEIKVQLPESNDQLVSQIIPDRTAVPDTFSSDVFPHIKDSLSIQKQVVCEETVSIETDTVSDNGIGQTHYYTNNYLCSNYSKKYKPTISIGISGGPGIANRGGTLVQVNAPTGESLGAVREEVSYSHLPPISFGISMNIRFSKRFAFVTGLDYSLYKTYKEVKSQYYERNEIQQLHYLGLPIRCNYSIFSNKSFKWYVGGGVEIEKCIFAKSGSASLSEQNLLWSAIMTTGIQYRLADQLSFFCEPYYSYLLSETSLVSYRTDNPVGLSARLGVRIDL